MTTPIPTMTFYRKETYRDYPDDFIGPPELISETYGYFSHNSGAVNIKDFNHLKRLSGQDLLSQPFNYRNLGSIQERRSDGTREVSFPLDENNWQQMLRYIAFNITPPNGDVIKTYRELLYPKSLEAPKPQPAELPLKESKKSLLLRFLTRLQFSRRR